MQVLLVCVYPSSESLLQLESSQVHLFLDSCYSDVCAMLSARTHALLLFMLIDSYLLLPTRLEASVGEIFVALNVAHSG